MLHLFIHLSDLHVKRDTNIIDSNIEKLVKSIKEYKNFDELYFLFSGDISYSGEKSEYSNFIGFITRLIKIVKNELNYHKHINFFFVPGNHDNYYNDYNSSREKVNKMLRDAQSEKEKNELVKRELNKQQYFFEFADYHKNFQNNPLVDVKILQRAECVMQINLINSSLFSTLEDDKGLLYIPFNELHKIKKDNNRISISMMHHPPSWFKSFQCNDVENSVFSNSNVLIVGHEHKSRNKDLTYNNQGNVIILDGGKIDLDKLLTGDSFNSFIYDSQSDSVISGNHVWSEQKNVFEYNKMKEKNKILERGMLNSDFISNIMNDTKSLASSFEDYFVFPKLCNYIYDINSSDALSNFDEFYNAVKDKEIISIYGSTEMGKTSILKKLFLELYKKHRYVIFINSEYDPLNNIERLIKSKIEEQYFGDFYSFDDFKQNSNGNILLLDNFHFINEQYKDKVLKLFKSHFDKIILTSSKDRESSDLDKLRLTYDIHEYKIVPFVGEKRKELIYKVLNLESIEKIESISLLCSYLDNVFSKNVYMFDFRTGFIVDYIKYYSNNSNLVTEKIKNYDEVFQANIINRINNCGGEKHNFTNEILEVLTALAFGIHKEKKYPFSESLMISLVSDVIEKFDYRIKVIEMINYFLDSKIIIRHNDMYKFSSKSYLAFFVARAIFQNYENYDNYDQIKEVLSTLCFGINGDVLLFLVMFSKSPRLLFKLLEEAKEFVSDWKEFSFEEYNKTLFPKLKELNVTLATIEEKHEIHEQKSDLELKKIENIDIEIDQLYDYSIDDAMLMGNQILIAKKYLDTISRGFSNFVHLIDTEKKQQFLDYIYSAPNKILGIFLSNLDENYNEILDELVEYILEKESCTPDEGRIKAQIFLTDIVTAIIPALINDVSDIVIDRKSADYFFDYYEKHKIDHNVRELIVNVTLHNTNNIIELKNRIYTRLGKIEKIIVRKIIRKYILTTDMISMPMMQRLTANMFDVENTKKMFVEKKKNQIMKENYEKENSILTKTE